MENYSAALQSLNDEKWQRLSVPEKLSLLQEIENETAVREGRNPCLVTGEFIPSDDTGVTLGYYNRGTRSIASGFSTFITFHLNDVVSRDYVRDLYGKNLILEQYTQLDNSLVENQRQGYTVEDWNIQNLKLGEAIIGLPFQKPFRFQVDLFK